MAKQKKPQRKPRKIRAKATPAPLPSQPPAEDQHPLPLQDQQPIESPLQDPQPAAGDSGSDADRPGLDELQQLAQGDQPAAPAGGAAPGAPDPSAAAAAAGIKVYVVTEEHRFVAAGLTGTLAKTVEGFLPVRYGPETVGKATEVITPLVAKHYDKFPLWYLQWREEITALAVLGKIGIDTWKEVRRVNEIEAQIEELASKYRAEGANRKQARERAIQELGYNTESGSQAA